jgi:hypothetical protein
MDYKFLDKVLDHIVRETRIDYNERTIFLPFSFSPFSYSCYSLQLLLLFSPFSKHCKEVYGLNKGEIEYVWDEYKKIIKEKLNNGL